jgi:hypothetical protein
VFLETIAVFLIALTVMVSVSLLSLKRELEEKSRIKDYVMNSIEAVEKDFTTNREYGLPFVKGVKAVKKDGRVILFSQSKIANLPNI